MSKSTLAAIAAFGAGSVFTAAAYSIGSGKSPEKAAPTITTSGPSNPVPAPSATVPASQVFAQGPPPPPPPPPPMAAPTPYGAPTPYSQPLPGSSGGSGLVDPSGLFSYGFPGPVSDLAVRSSLVSAYDRRLRNPHWVAEHITPASLAKREGDRQNSNFLEDPSVPEAFRARLKDYFRSGFDRGHQVPAADARWSQTAVDETFYLTNMCPQVGDGFNRDYWAHVEDFVRRLTGKYPSVRCVTGPLYLPKRDPADGKWYVKYEMIGSPSPAVAVPTHFYKVIFAETTPDSAKPGNTSPVAVGAFVLPNAKIPNETPLSNFEVPLEMVERASGLEFASKLAVQRRRRLCADTTCSLVIKEYQKAVKGKK